MSDNETRTVVEFVRKVDTSRLGTLSTELLIRIVSFLDVPSLLRFGCVNSVLQHLPPLSPIWVLRFNELWISEKRDDPFLPENREFCRQQLFNRAHVRMDGAYVSRCLYSRRVQEGASLTDTRTYLQIVYHRILRFLPGGEALMLLSEKGSKGAAKAGFDDLVSGDSDQLDKHGKQAHRCRWRCLSEDEEGAVIHLTYFDGTLCWSAKLLACHGTSRRQAGSRLAWLEYKFWDPVEVASRRRTYLFRERERVSARLRLAHLNGTNADTISDMLFQVERLTDAMNSVRPMKDEWDVSQVPEDLQNDIRLWPEHFPVFRFGHAKILAHLF